MKSSMTFIQTNGCTEIDLILKQTWRRFIWRQVSFKLKSLRIYLRIQVHSFVCNGKWKDTGHVSILWRAKLFSKIYTRPVSFGFPMQTKNSELQSVHLCLSDEKTLQKRTHQCQCFRHVTSVFYWKIFATVSICFIAGECHGRVNIVVWISDLFKIVENCEVKAFGDFHVGLRPVLHIFFFFCVVYIFVKWIQPVRMMLGVSSCIPNINTERVKGILCHSGHENNMRSTRSPSTTSGDRGLDKAVTSDSRTPACTVTFCTWQSLM